MSDPIGLDVVGRLLPALALLVGVLLLLRRRARGGRGRGLTGLRVLARTALTRTSVVAVVEVDGRRFLVGAADQEVSLLSELQPGDEPDPDEPSALAARAGRGQRLHPPAATDWRATVSTDRPWMGLIDRLRGMTVRTHLEEPIRGAHS